jgi:hypothetical protein
MTIRFSRPCATLALLAAAAVFVAPFTARAASNSEQIVFSGVGVPPTSTEAFGFWIWCQSHQATPSKGQYLADCNGSLYFYTRGIVAHVVGEVTEPAAGAYEMSVATRDGSVACTLDNVPPVTHGPTNTVTASCTVSGEDVTGLESVTAVVTSTGP